MPSPAEEHQELFQRVTSNAGFAPSLATSIRIMSMDDVPEADGETGRRRVDGWKMTYEGLITDEMTNLIGNLHGAATSWLIDTLTSAALVQLHTPTFWGPPMLAGVSLSMETQFLSPGTLSNKILVDVEVLKCTPTLANLRCEIKDMKSGVLIAVGTHLKIWKPMVSAKL